MSLDKRNEELEKRLEHNPVDEQIAALVRADKRRKFQITALALLTVGLIFLSVRTTQIAGQAESNRAAIVARCVATNEARAKNEKLWDYLIDQGKNQPRTKEQQMFFDNFVKLKDDTFAPTDCSKVDKR